MLTRKNIIQHIKTIPEIPGTERLLLKTVDAGDADFIQALVNTDGWLRFIGDRNIRSRADALQYIDRLLGAENLRYWVVRTKESGMPVGIVSFLKRDYLEHFDIGFAFLPLFFGKGYAFEATGTVLNIVTQYPAYQTVLATTMPSNEASIRLLEKLKFHLKDQLEHNGETLLVYSNQ